MKKNPFALPVARLSGVGDKTVQALHKNNIVTIFDLLLHTPKSLVSQEQAPGFLHMEAGRTYVATGKVVATKLSGGFHKKRLEVILQDDTGRMTAIFFGPAVTYAQQALKVDEKVRLIGIAKDFLGRIQMVHPKILSPHQNIDENVATYSQIGGLNSVTFKRIIDKALGHINQENTHEHLTADFLSTYKMSSIKTALCQIHLPTHNVAEADWDKRAQSPHYRRLAFEEVLSFYFRLNVERGITKHKSGIAITPRPIDELSCDFLPFTLTNAQQRACEEIVSDMSKERAMSRLLQGDVGCGKTAVSAIASLHAVQAECQVAIMAPTEILAEQLFKIFTDFFAKKPHHLALLTANLKGKDRQLLAERIASHDVSVVIGTHALLSEDISFHRLGLVIIDEQHRFGVKQRADLLHNCHNDEAKIPHLLVMSATPIPRSLALTFYGDLDLSVIDERPKGREPIHTQVLVGSVLDNIVRICKRIIETKQKAFIVFPLVEESEHLDLENATKALLRLRDCFGESTTMLLHGKMKPQEKMQAMMAFRDNQISLLVATTVVEVGIDVPDATCMVIAHPERFGLAQLHQLRGRVGRKNLKSYCLLVTDMTNRFGTANKRLEAMCKNDNGFKLAEIDLEIRGPGELLGTKQSGLPNFIIFNHVDFADLVYPAKTLARTIYEQGLTPVYEHLLGQSAHFS